MNASFDRASCLNAVAYQCYCHAALQLPTHGLLNVIAAPQLGDASTYRAMYTSGAGHPQARLGSESGSPASPFQQQQQQGDSTTTQPGSQSADVIPAAASGDHDEYQATPLKQAHAGSHVGDRGSDRQQASDGGASSTSHPGDSSTGHSSKSKKQAHGRVVSGSSSSSHDSVGLLSRKLGRDHSSSNSGSSSAGGQQVVNPSMQQGGDEGDVGGGSDLVDLAIDDEEVQAVSRKLRDAGFPAKVCSSDPGSLLFSTCCVCWWHMSCTSPPSIVLHNLLPVNPPTPFPPLLPRWVGTGPRVAPSLTSPPRGGPPAGRRASSCP
jgi:hypothetical protein